MLDFWTLQPVFDMIEQRLIPIQGVFITNITPFLWCMLLSE
uniref:Uncharacterized protein n=1 Tax=Rhizophora mucronata TaxID=61149 RepID=A0A2P2Q345_RHIMU